MAENNRISSVAASFIYLTACELSGVRPERSYLASAEDVLGYAKNNGMEALVASALLGLEPSDRAREAINLSVRNTLLFDAQRGEISRRLSEAKIRHLVLKGAIIKELYPKIGYRQMSDNDILVDSLRRSEVKEIMTSLGFSVEGEGSCHDVYMKPPVYNFEMHTALFNEIESQAFSEYFDGFIDRAEPFGSEYSLKVSDEDFYIYLKAHENKHFSIGGTGIRSLVDTYVFINAKGDKLDWSYLSAEFEKIGILEYEKQTRELSEKIFSPDGALALVRGEDLLTDREAELLSYFCTSGTYGNVSNRVKNELLKIGEGKKGCAKLRYVIRRIFPSMDWYKVNAPFYYRHKLLIPFFVLKRLLLAVIFAPKRAFCELKQVINSKGKGK